MGWIGTIASLISLKSCISLYSPLGFKTGGLGELQGGWCDTSGADLNLVINNCNQCLAQDK
jgi:hypothetical protein